MDNETLPPAAQPLSGASHGLQRAPTPNAAPLEAHVPSADHERTSVFTNLVKEDNDISGLVAYSIYKQNKLDWLQAFEAAKGRAPDEAELAAYIIGEGTPRRLATYRHLAESTLAGKGPDIDRAPSRHGMQSGAGQANHPLTPRMIVVYGIVVILCVIAFWFAAHYTVSNR